MSRDLVQDYPEEFCYISGGNHLGNLDRFDELNQGASVRFRTSSWCNCESDDEVGSGGGFGSGKGFGNGGGFGSGNGFGNVGFGSSKGFGNGGFGNGQFGSGSAFGSENGSSTTSSSGSIVSVGGSSGGFKSFGGSFSSFGTNSEKKAETNKVIAPDDSWDVPEHEELIEDNPVYKKLQAKINELDAENSTMKKQIAGNKYENRNIQKFFKKSELTDPDQVEKAKSRREAEETLWFRGQNFIKFTVSDKRAKEHFEIYHDEETRTSTKLSLVDFYKKYNIDILEDEVVLQIKELHSFVCPASLVTIATLMEQRMSTEKFADW